MPFLNDVLLEALDVFKNFQTFLSFSTNLNFWSISIGSDFSKSETVVSHILQSGASKGCRASKDVKVLQDVEHL